MPTGYLSASTIRQRTIRHDRGPGRVQRVDRIAFDADLQSKVVHENGMVDYHGVATRGGVAFVYEEPEGEVREFRPISEVMDPESLKGLHVAPYSIDHPGDGVDDDLGLGEVTLENARGLIHGAVLSVEPEPATGLVKVWIRVWTPEAIESIEGGKVELSCGYTTVLIDWRTPEGAAMVAAMNLGPELGLAANGERYDLVQTEIRYNHISGVDEARAGSIAALRTDKAISMKLKYDGKVFTVGQFIADAVKAQVVDAAKAKTDQLEVGELTIEGQTLVVPMAKIKEIIAILGGDPAAGPSLPEPELEPPIVADAVEEELEPNIDAQGDEPKMDAKTIGKMIQDGIAKAMPAAAAKVTDSVATTLRDRADLERLAAPALGPAFNYQDHDNPGLAVQVLDAAKSPKLTQATALADLARKGDGHAAGKLEAWMEASLEAHRDAQDSSGDLGQAMFAVANQDAQTAPPARSEWRKKQDALRRSSTGQPPLKADTAAA